MPPVLARRLHSVVAKGDVGKTEVPAALAMLLARRGRRTLVVELDATGRLAALLGARAPGYTPVEAAKQIWLLAVDGKAALEEYLGLIIPVRRLLATVFSSHVYQY